MLTLSYSLSGAWLSSYCVIGRAWIYQYMVKSSLVCLLDLEGKENIETCYISC